MEKIIKFLCKFQIYRNRDILYGFYTRSSIFQPYRITTGSKYRKQELMFAFKNNEYHILYI